MPYPQWVTLRRLALLLWVLALAQAWWRCHSPLRVEMSAQGQVQPAWVRVQVRRGDKWVQVEERASGEVRLVAAGYQPAQVTAGAGSHELWAHPLPVLLESPLLYAGLALLAWSWARKPQGQLEKPPPERPRVAAYTILQSLGEGVQSEVFLAEADSGLKVALKLIKEADQEFRTRFEREAELCARMDHPRIVRTLGWGEHDGRLWMAQSYLPGQTLRGWVQGRGLHPSEVRRLLTQIAEGLAYAHRFGVMHRDLKPDNVLLNARGQAVIGDFGLARCLDMQTLTRTDQVLGSPAYMSPEQIQGVRQLTPASDLYALGVIGFELLVGRLPFQGDLMQVMMGHLSDKPPVPSRFREGIPAPLEALILQLLEKDPGRRPATAEEVIARIREDK